MTNHPGERKNGHTSLNVISARNPGRKQGVVGMKKQLRKEVLQERMALSQPEVDSRSKQICARLAQMPEFSQAQTVKFFIVLRNEVATGEAILKALSLGKRVVVPITDVPNRKITPSQIFHYPEDLQPGAYGILKPRLECVRPVPPQKLILW